MKITIKNFGPISHYCFDLDKDFNLLVGENNVGKSYAITVVYLIVKAFFESDDSTAFQYRHGFFVNARYIGYVQESRVFKVVEGMKFREHLDVTDIFKEDMVKVLNDTFISVLSDYFSNSFSMEAGLSNAYAGDRLEIVIDMGECQIVVGLDDKDELCIKSYDNKGKVCVKCLKRHRVSRTDNNQAFDITLPYMEDDTSKLRYDYADLIVSKMYRIRGSAVGMISGIYYLPASRSGLYQALGAFGQIVAELSKNRSFLKKKIELPGIPEPVSDYFLKLSDIRAKKVRSDGVESRLNKIAESIEADILKGRIEFDQKVNQFYYRPDNTDLRLDLSSTSSMVSELSPIVSFLRHVIVDTTPRRDRGLRRNQMKPLVMIEEPEAHLHPEVQIRITEIFADMIDSDIKLVITTHSNYIFNKVNNLIMSKRLNYSAVDATIFRKTEQGSCGEVLEIDQFGVDDDNFIRATEWLYQEKLDLVEDWNDR